MTIVGDGDLKFEMVSEWPELPESWEFSRCSDVAVDSRDRVWVFSRGRHPVTVWTPEGEFVTSWGEGEFRNPHGMFIDAEDQVWLVDSQLHVVTRHRPDGEVTLELGARGWAMPTLVADMAASPASSPNGSPFNMPSGVALNQAGEIFVSDGYGNRRVHRFSAAGELETSWGTLGTGPGEFALPHNVGVDRRGRILICDRENDRIQIFDRDGQYLTEWTDLLMPGDVCMDLDGLVYVVEQGQPTGVSVLTMDGELVTRWRGSVNGQLEAPHGIWVDSRGDVYVAEIGEPGHGQRMRKFVRV